ncbi:MAG: DUF2848 family protein [Proteobacteria bacterium]|nr:DUF2848 family protein [Pseudomonadota bacterium]
MSFLFQPHVHSLDAVITPDLRIETLIIVDGGAGSAWSHAIGVDRLTTETEIQVVGSDTAACTGVIFIAAGYGTLVGVANDHVDTSLVSNAAVARQVCPKPLGRQVWRYTDLKNHLERLILRCWNDDGKSSDEVQLGDVRSMIEAASIGIMGIDDLPIGSAILVSGLTEPTRGSPVHLEIEDPVHGRKLKHRFAVHELPDGSVSA